MSDALRERVKELVEELENRAARYGTAAAQPLGVEMGPNGEPHTRRNRHVLMGLSGGLNEAAGLLNAILAETAPAKSASGSSQLLALLAATNCTHTTEPEAACEACIASALDEQRRLRGGAR